MYFIHQDLVLEQELITPGAAGRLLNEANEKQKKYTRALNKLPFSKDFNQQDIQKATRRKLLQEEKSSLNNLYVTGLIDEETLHRLRAELEAESLLLEQSGVNGPAIKKVVTGQPPSPGTRPPA